tara:strand:- start:3336 stop:5516 length:2181 start_codon:yes stop_codon:yes gene_type:complete
MPLAKYNIAPGFDKQSTPSDAEGRWVDGDNVRFRYGEPEKIGGWQALVNKELVGAARAQHVWANTAGKKYAAIGTNKVLVIYFDGAFYDITPLDTDNFSTGANITTTNGSSTVTITTSGSHGLQVGDIITFANAGSFTSSDTDYTASDFDDQLFEVKTVPTVLTFTITMPSTESKAGVTTNGTLDVRPYVTVGPLNQTSGFGWGTYFFGGRPVAEITTTMNNSGNMLVGDSSVVLTNSSLFPASGKIRIGSEDMEYTTNTTGTNTISGISRGINGTTVAEHTNGSTVTDITEYTGWGDASSSTSVIIEPGNWSLDNFGNTLIATVHDGETFTWDASLTNALSTRATIGSGMPTKSVMTIVSDRDRHLFHLGTETTIGTSSTQDKMFIRFSDQESTSVYEPTSTNTSGTFRLDDGTRIIGAFKGKDYILVLTDTAAYEMQFVGPPFTFSIRKVGSNNGLLGQHAGVFANGAVYWMGKTGGFYVYDGTVKSLPCLVEDFVFTTDGNNPGINYDSGQLVYGGINELYSEINWFYPTSGSDVIDRVVTYNFDENVWTTGTLDRSTWVGSTVYEKPYATDYNASNTPTFPVVSGVSNGASIYYAHEVGINQQNGDGTQTAITSFIKSGEFDLNGRQGVPGDGEFLMSIKRFLPDFKRISGDAKVTLFLNQFPQGTTASSSPLGPFTLSSTSSKVDTRARARLVAVQVENEGLNQSWRYGSFRFDIRPDGRR